MLFEFVEKLARELGLNVPEESKEKIYILTIGPRIELKFFDQEKEIFLYSNVDAFFSENREDLLIKLMQANFLGQATGSAVLGATSDEKYLTLSDVMPYELTYQEFRNRVEDFVNYLRYWQHEIDTYEKKIQQNLY